MKPLSFVHVPKTGGVSIREVCNYINVKYLWHDVDVRKLTTDYFIVIRDPVDRFCSAVNFIQSPVFRHIFHFETISDNLITPDEWVSIMFNNTHPHYDHISKIFFAQSRYPITYTCDMPAQYIGASFSNQHFWYNSPKYVILFENIATEFDRIVKHRTHKTITLPHANASSGIKNLSNDSVKKIREMYSEDVKLYEYYTELSPEKRLPFS